MIQMIFFPLSFLLAFMHSKKSILLRLIFGAIFFLAACLGWSYLSTLTLRAGLIAYIRIGQQVGYSTIDVPIAGTGSMFPTFPKGTSATPEERELEIVARAPMRVYPGGIEVFHKTYLEHMLQRRDIVSFSNATTQKILASSPNGQDKDGFVKRVIGLPGDSIELRDGYVLLNGDKLDEPYIAQARSTFGGTTLPECTPVLIPPNQALVLGDNRKASEDSRYELGFVPLPDIKLVLPWEKQDTYKSAWRDTSLDSSQADHSTLDPDSFVQQLNQYRKEQKKPLLKLQPKLTKSAELRAGHMISDNDFSFEATRSGYTMKKSMQQAGYSNIVYGEAPVVGYYTADELMDHLKVQKRWQDFLLNPEYQDIGISSQIGYIQGCPTQVVLLQLAGYVPPNYSETTIQSWNSSVTRLQDLYQNWLQVRGYGAQYEQKKTEYERLLSMIQERIDIAKIISQRMSKNEWLTDQEKALMDKEKDLYVQQDALAKSLNNQ